MPGVDGLSESEHEVEFPTQTGRAKKLWTKNWCGILGVSTISDGTHLLMTLLDTCKKYVDGSNFGAELV